MSADPTPDRPCPNHPPPSTLAAITCRLCGAFKHAGQPLKYYDPVTRRKGDFWGRDDVCFHANERGDCETCASLDRASAANRVLANEPDALSRIADTLGAILSRWRDADALAAKVREEERAASWESKRTATLQWIWVTPQGCPYCGRQAELLCRGNEVFACAACLAEAKRK